MFTYDKICPLLNSKIPSENKCKGQKCAFAVKESKMKWDGKTQTYLPDGFNEYCLVRNFLFALANRE